MKCCAAYNFCYLIYYCGNSLGIKLCMFGGKLGFRVRARLLAELKLTLLGKFAGFSVQLIIFVT